MKRGFAAMDPEKQREIARSGGRATSAKGVGHQFTPEEARAAGRLGGAVTSANRLHMRKIGKLGGKARGRGAPCRSLCPWLFFASAS